MTTLSIPFQRVSAYKQKVTQLFSLAGITVNGVPAYGSLDLGESYEDGWWDCNRIDILFTKIIRAILDRYVPHNL